MRARPATRLTLCLFCWAAGGLGCGGVLIVQRAVGCWATDRQPGTTRQREPTSGRCCCPAVLLHCCCCLQSRAAVGPVEQGRRGARHAGSAGQRASPAQPAGPRQQHPAGAAAHPQRWAVGCSCVERQRLLGQVGPQAPAPKSVVSSQQAVCRRVATKSLQWDKSNLTGTHASLWASVCFCCMMHPCLMAQREQTPSC